ECPATEFGEGEAEWIASDRARVVETENELATRLRLEPGELLIDFPVKTQMLDLDLPVLRKNGRVERLTGWTSAINLPALSTQLYRWARWLGVFTARPVTLPKD